MNKHPVISILGAGSWGTAIAIHLAQQGYDVRLWGRDKHHIKMMQQERCNKRYLPDDLFPSSLIPVESIAACIADTDAIIVAVPSHVFADVLDELPKALTGLSWLTKGLDPVKNCLLSDLVFARYGGDFPINIISGPSFAKEVAKLMPTAMTIAGNDDTYQRKIHVLLHHQHLRVYFSDDIYGVQICGAVKNVLAIACGISDGLGFGANARAALITRGLAEMTRLGMAIGASQDTFAGLAGMGDLVLTCTDNQSRNRRFGLLLGQGLSVTEAQNQIGQVVEGRHNAHQVCVFAKQYHIDMPISTLVDKVLSNHISIHQVVDILFDRPAKNESC